MEELMSANHSSLNGSPVADSGPQNLGDVLRYSRLEQGLSLRALAKRVGLSAHSGVAEYERGNRIPPADLIESYERALALPAGYLKNLRQQVLRERASSTKLDQSELSATPAEPASAAADQHVFQAAATILVTMCAALVAIKVRQILRPATGPGGARDRPTLIHIHIHGSAAAIPSSAYESTR
jgi:transcriptional regulator with XRE-family HTH domain